MTRKVTELRDLEIDEISLVDKGANQHARTVIAKRHDEEDMMDEYFDAEGNPVDVASLELGDVVYDEDGEAYELDLEDDEDEGADVEDRELAGVGKRASNPFTERIAKRGETTTVSSLRQEFAKALSDGDRDAVVSKALDALADLESVSKAASEQAEAERQMRLDREYTEVAKNYSVGIDPEVLGPVLKRAAESLDRDDCEVLAVALDSASAANEMFTEIGKSGTNSNSDVFAQIDAYLDENVSKSDASREALVSKVFEENPDAYDEFLREQDAR